MGRGPGAANELTGWSLGKQSLQETGSRRQEVDHVKGTDTYSTSVSFSHLNLLCIIHLVNLCISLGFFLAKISLKLNSEYIF